MTHVVAPCAPSPLRDRNVWVSGAHGAFGQAFVRRALDDGAARVAAFCHSEAKMAAMRAALPDERIRYMLGDVLNPERLAESLRGVEIAVHAAALKRVEICEEAPDAATDVNILGTRAVAQAVTAAGVSRALYLSTDKAASPETAYGLSKAMAEREWTQYNARSAGTNTHLAISRYGNVAHSTGSVIPFWKEQAAYGRPLSITDRRMTRFTMRMSDAVDLVLIALNTMRGGEIFLPKIRPARMVDLATAISPRSPQVDIGIRGEEKLYETLIAEGEVRRLFDRGDHYVIEPAVRTWCGYLPEIGRQVSPDFVYRSDVGPFLSVDELRALVAA